MRVLTLVVIGAALGVGGVALAQPTLVVDPWGRANGDADSWFDSAEAPRDDRLPVEAVLKDPWAPSTEAKATPVAAPLKPFETRRVEPANASAASSTGPMVIDPWAPLVPPEIPSLGAHSERVAPSRPSPLPWSDRVVEIIDPWKRMPEFATNDRIRLVVDPWAR